MMTRQLAIDYPTEFRVNCICPGTVDSPFVEAYLEKYHKNEKEKVRAELNQRQPIGRLGRPGEIAHLALYLASEEAAFMNGSVYTIDGADRGVRDHASERITQAQLDVALGGLTRNLAEGDTARVRIQLVWSPVGVVGEVEELASQSEPLLLPQRDVFE